MSFWNGTRWTDDPKPRTSRPATPPRDGRARLVDLIATGGMAIILAALFVPFTPAAAVGVVLTLTPPDGAAGSSVQLKGSAFPSRVRLEIAWDGVPIGLTVQANGYGSFRTTFVVPVAATGSHTVSAIEVSPLRRTKSADGNASTLAAATFTITDPVAGPLPTDDPSAGATATPGPADPTSPAVTAGPPTTEPDRTRPPTEEPTPAPQPTPTEGPTPEPQPTPGPTAIPTPTATPPPAPTPHPTPTSTPDPTPTPPTHLVALGAYLPGAPSDPSKIDAYASLTGEMPNIVMWYQEWAGEWNAFYARGADAIRARGAMPLISWEPWSGTKTDTAWSLKTIIDGNHDAYIHAWTQDVAAWGHPIYVRPMYEMNGPWSAWGYGVNGNTAAQFVSAWKHIVNIANAEGATNIRWVWSPNVDDGDPRYASYSSLYPGDAYVDWVGLDGYNWGTSQSWSSWDGLYRVFNGSVDKIRAITNKPIMIAETGSSELGGDKAAWITDGFDSLLSKLPQVRALIWFNANKETDWRVNSSAAALAAFKVVASSSAFSKLLP